MNYNILYSICVEHSWNCFFHYVITAVDVSMEYTPSYFYVKDENRFGFKTFEGIMEITSRSLKYIKKSNDDFGNAEWEQDELLYGHD